MERRNAVCQVTPDVFCAAPSKNTKATFKCCAWEVLIPWIFVAYTVFCVLMMHSPFLQGTLVYLHHARIPVGDLTNLQRFGLLNARNIEMVTEDGVELKGYHLLPPTVVGKQSYRKILALNDTVSACNADEKDPGKSCLWNDFFDQELQHHAHRVIIYLHGNGATRAIQNRIEIAKSLASQFDAHVISVDYRSFADSGRVVSREVAIKHGRVPIESEYAPPNEEGTYLDALAMLQWVLKKTGKCRTRDGQTLSTDAGADDDWGISHHKDKLHRRAPPAIYIYGHSLGTGVGVDLLHRLTVPGAVNHTAEGPHHLANDCASWASIVARWEQTNLHQKMQNEEKAPPTEAVGGGDIAQNKTGEAPDDNGKGTGTGTGRGGGGGGGGGSRGGMFGTVFGGVKAKTQPTAPVGKEQTAKKEAVPAFNTTTLLSSIPLVNGLILDSGFSSLPEAAMDHPLGAVFRLFPAVRDLVVQYLVYRYESQSKIDAIFDAKVPILLLHSVDDVKVPFSHSVTLYNQVYLAPSANYVGRVGNSAIDAKNTTYSNSLAEHWYEKCFFNERSRCIHHHDHVQHDKYDGGSNEIYCENQCPLRLVQILYADHNNVHYSKLWSHHIYDFIEYAEERFLSALTA